MCLHVVRPNWQFPTKGSDDPPPLGVKNVKFGKILKKSGDPLQGPLKN